MGFNNTLVVISNKSELIEQISSKLVLLRDLDKVANAPIKGALEFLKVQIPNVIMLHCYKNDSESIGLVKQIRADEILKDIPILFLSENCTREAIIEAFDAGINDILTCPALDFELLIRTIWCVQKGEINTQKQTHLGFMKRLGIIEEKTGVYAQQYCKEFLKNELENIAKFKTHASMMLITPDSKRPSNMPEEEFLRTIKNSLRLNDSVIIKGDKEYYILLPKTKLNGVYPVFERINKNLAQNCSINGSVAEIKNRSFEDIKEILQNALDKAKEEVNSLIVASSAYLKDQNIPVNIAKQSLARLKNAVGEKKMQQSTTKTRAEATLDGRNGKMYRQVYKQKCKIVYGPVFEKYQTHIVSNDREAKVEYEVNLEKTKFTILKDNARASLRITYGGMFKVKIDTAVIYCDATKSTNSLVMDFVNLDFKKLSLIIEELFNEFKTYAKNEQIND